MLELEANVNTQANNGETAPHALLLNASKINSTKAKLPTLKLLLNTNNKPPYDPTLKMQGGTAQDWLKLIISEQGNNEDLMGCQKLFEEYNEWYDKAIAEPSLLGAEFANFVLY